MQELLAIMKEHNFLMTLVMGGFLFGTIILIWVLQARIAKKFPIYRRVGVNIAAFWGILAAFVVIRDGDASNDSISLWVVGGAIVVSLSLVFGHTFENIRVNKGDVEVYLGGGKASEVLKNEKKEDKEREKAVEQMPQELMWNA